VLAAFSAPASRWVSTDDNLYLEYSTPKGNVLDGQQSLDRNVAFLRKYSPESSAKEGAAR
jgi:spermidine synthase